MQLSSSGLPARPAETLPGPSPSPSIPTPRVAGFGGKSSKGRILAAVCCANLVLLCAAFYFGATHRGEVPLQGKELEFHHIRTTLSKHPELTFQEVLPGVDLVLELYGVSSQEAETTIIKDKVVHLHTASRQALLNFSFSSAGAAVAVDGFYFTVFLSSQKVEVWNFTRFCWDLTSEVEHLSEHGEGQEVLLQDPHRPNGEGFPSRSRATTFFFQTAEHFLVSITKGLLCLAMEVRSGMGLCDDAMKLLFFSSLWCLIAAQANEWEALSPTGSIPVAREFHTAVWSDMADGCFIFGGIDPDNYALSELYLYRREANTWEALSPTGSIPLARAFHTAVWSDTADGFFIFGGWNGGQLLNDVYLYRREANTWEKLSPTGSIPIARHGHSAVWSDAADGFFMFGGFLYAGSRLNDLYLYRREANTWEELSPTGSIPSARNFHTAVWSDRADGFFIFGGSGSNRLNDMYFYSREANTWEALSPTGSIPSAHQKHSAVWSDMVDGCFIFGGWDGDSRLNDLYLYRREANMWETFSPTGSIPSARDGHTAVWSDRADGFFIFGGSDGNRLNDMYVSREITTTTATMTTATSTSMTRTEDRVDRSDKLIFMNVGRWTVAATVFYMVLFGVPVAIYAHLMEPGIGMDRE
eukprot:symbB.v1.2.002214.t1/scaffold119.1/size318073/12